MGIYIFLIYRNGLLIVEYVEEVTIELALVKVFAKYGKFPAAMIVDI